MPCHRGVHRRAGCGQLSPVLGGIPVADSIPTHLLFSRFCTPGVVNCASHFRRSRYRLVGRASPELLRQSCEQSLLRVSPQCSGAPSRQSVGVGSRSVINAEQSWQSRQRTFNRDSYLRPRVAPPNLLSFSRSLSGRSFEVDRSLPSGMLDVVFLVLLGCRTGCCAECRFPPRRPIRQSPLMPTPLFASGALLLHWISHFCSPWRQPATACSPPLRSTLEDFALSPGA